MTRLSVRFYETEQSDCKFARETIECLREDERKKSINDKEWDERE